MSNVSLKDLDSGAALAEYLRADGSPYVLVGVDAECPRSFWSFDFSSTNGRLRVGIIASNHGIRASWTASSDGGILAIGHDESVSFVDVAKCSLLSVRPLNGVFYEFILGDWHDQFIVLHELGAAKFDFLGSQNWSVSTDILEGWNMLNDQTLVLRHQGSEKEVVIDIRSGATLGR